MNQIKQTKDVKAEYCFPSYETNEIKEAFDCFDVNHKGYIGVMELKEIFSVIQEEVSDEEMDEMIKMADKEGDGQVNWLNFFEFITGNGIDQEISKMNNNLNDISVKHSEVLNSHYQIKGEKTLNKQSNRKKTLNDNNIVPVSLNSDTNYRQQQVVLPHKKQLVIKRKSQSQETESKDNNTKDQNSFDIMNKTKNSNLLKSNRGYSQEDEYFNNSQLKENFISSMLKKNQIKQKQFEVIDVDTKPKSNMIVLKPSLFEKKELQVKEEERELKVDLAGMKNMLFKTKAIKNDEEREEDNNNDLNKQLHNERSRSCDINDHQSNESEAFKRNTSLIKKQEPFIDKIDHKDKNINTSYSEHLQELKHKMPNEHIESTISHRSRFNLNLMGKNKTEEDINTKYNINTRTISVKSKTSHNNSSQNESESKEITKKINTNEGKTASNPVVITNIHNTKINKEDKQNIIDVQSQINNSHTKSIKDSDISKMDLEEEEKRLKKEQEIEELVYHSNENEDSKDNDEGQINEEDEDEDENNTELIKNSNLHSIKTNQMSSIRESLEKQKNRIQTTIIDQQLKRELNKEYSLKQQKDIESIKTNEDIKDSLKSNKQSGSSAVIIETIPLCNHINFTQSNNNISEQPAIVDKNIFKDNNSQFSIEQDSELNIPLNTNTNDQEINQINSINTIKYPLNNLISNPKTESKSNNKDDNNSKTKEEKEENEGIAILRKRPLSKQKETIEHSNPIHKQKNTINKHDSEIIIANTQDYISITNSFSNKSSMQSHESKRKTHIVPKGVFPKIKKDVIKKFIQKEQITPIIIKSFYSKFEFQSSLFTLASYEEFLKLYEFSDSEEAKDFFETFRTINSDEHLMPITDSLILLLNSTSLHKEEKFKFEFLCFDKDKSKFLSKEELIHLLELNFLSNTTNDINKKLQLIIVEIKKMNLYDTEVYDYDVLLEILRQKSNLFFPY